MMSFRIASRLGKLSVMPTRSCSRHLCSDASKAWMDQRQTHRTSAHRHRGMEERSEDPDLDDVDDKVQAVFSEERRRQRTVKYHIVKRQLTESGAPERMLSWDAMEQIRYLKQELPEEWTVERLAEGFSVHRDVILRVLRSKFAPTPERKAKQDTSVWARLRQQALPGGGAGGQERQVALPGGGAGGQERQVALPGGGAGGQERQVALPGGGAGGQERQVALPGGGQERQVALPGGRQGRQKALPGGRQGRQVALPGGGAGGQDRQVALPGGGGAGGLGQNTAACLGHRSSKPAMLPTGSGTGALVTLASHSSQKLIARDLEDDPGPRAMMTTANYPAAPLTSLPTQLSSPPTLHSRHTSGQDNSREEWEEEENVPEDNVSEKVEEKDDQEERWDGRVFSEEELEELMLSSKPSPVVPHGREFFDSEGNFLYRI
ncbi:LOW QUALITY PROTEIN: neugrin [Oncorhynchus nerka]|uniref:LOW QUALITY PROTEIN: neugrin n=1 Tax=Oncorhynchus nerka TaxID=8023 RepID=UPI0031B8573E